MTLRCLFMFLASCKYIVMALTRRAFLTFLSDCRATKHVTTCTIWTCFCENLKTSEIIPFNEPLSLVNIRPYVVPQKSPFSRESNMWNCKSLFLRERNTKMQVQRTELDKGLSLSSHPIVERDVFRLLSTKS